MPRLFQAYDSEFVTTVRRGGADVYGNGAELVVSDGVGTPCCNCLKNVPAGEDMLIVAARPFVRLHAYAETGPIFLCAANCTPWTSQGVPPVLQTSPDYLLKAYSQDERIVSGTGNVVLAADILSYIETVLLDPRVAFVDIRSSRNNCFLTRVTRSE